MIKKLLVQKRKENYLLFSFILISLILSNLSLPWVDSPTSMPNYFIALIVTFISLKKSSLNLYKLIIIGLGVDLLVGNLLGQYGVIFISIYALNFIINKILIIKTENQILSLAFLLILFSFLILWATSQSHNIGVSLNILFFQFILTLLIYLIFRTAINFFSKK
jgi:cell shape-determining protein MreD